jgi:hypothetical protein
MIFPVKRGARKVLYILAIVVIGIGIYLQNQQGDNTFLLLCICYTFCATLIAINKLK